MFKQLIEKHKKKQQHREESVKMTAELLDGLEKQLRAAKDEAAKCRVNATGATNALDAANWSKAAAYWDGRSTSLSQSVARIWIGRFF